MTISAKSRNRDCPVTETTELTSFFEPPQGVRSRQLMYVCSRKRQETRQERQESNSGTGPPLSSALPGQRLFTWLRFKQAGPFRTGVPAPATENLRVATAMPTCCAAGGIGSCGMPTSRLSRPTFELIPNTQPWDSRAQRSLFRASSALFYAHSPVRIDGRLHSLRIRFLHDTFALPDFRR